MITQRTIFEIHRMADMGLSARKIAKELKLCRKTVHRYLEDPNPKKPRFNRPSKLDPYKQEIDRLLEQLPDVSGQVIAQHLAPLGYTGGKTILCDYLKTVRERHKPRAFIRFESAPGEQMQIDWGHIGHITYGSTRRALYCMGVVEAHSRMLYLELTHCQDQQSLHRCLVNAFVFFGGTPRKIVHDNMKTALLERDGPLLRFNEAFLNFLRPFAIDPFACNPHSPWEKGKVEKGAIHYIKHNFMPLRSFSNLTDANAQASEWRDSLANIRIQRTTGEKPVLRFRTEALRPLSEVLPDCRQSAIVKVHKDFAINFDANGYTVPPWLIGKRLTLRADERSVWLFFNEKQVAAHLRCWQKRQRVELAQHREAALKHKEKYWTSHDLAVLMSLGEEMKSFLENLAPSRHGIKKSVTRLIELKNKYGEKSLLDAVRHAMAHNAFGPDYVENILARKPATRHPAVKLDNQELNRIHLTVPCLADYDAFVIQRRHQNE